MNSQNIVIFTDGSSRGNPGRGGWAAVIVYPDKEESRVVELGGYEEYTTNNQMELLAAINALHHVSSIKISISPLIIHTDSSYVINGITKWIFGWQKNKWMTAGKSEVVNRILWEKLIKEVKDKKIKWAYIGGHQGIAGNERCDEIATSFADGKKIKLYKGSLKEYKIDVLNVSLNKKVSKQRALEKTRIKAKAYSYLSMVNGEIMRHETWTDCENRVKGVSGARFKKALNAEEEKHLIGLWSSDKKNNK